MVDAVDSKTSGLEFSDSEGEDNVKDELDSGVLGLTATEESNNKRSVRPVSVDMFMDDAAEASGDESEEEEEEEEGNIDGLLADESEEAELARQSAKEAESRVHGHHERAMRDASDADVAKAAAHYDRRAEHYGGNSNDLDDVDIALRSNLPVTSGPKLFMVRVQPGKERAVCLKILSRATRSNQVGGDAPRILSALCRSGLEGMIYVEAMRAQAVTQALRGIPRTSGLSPQLIRVNEMTEVLKAPKPPKKLKRGQWVRVRRGEYKDDLARVVGMSRGSSNDVVVRLIPRLNLDAVARGGKRGGRQRGQRPVPRPFDINQATKFSGHTSIRDDNDQHLGCRVYIFKEQVYAGGFLHKKMKVKSLAVEGQVPTPAELAEFKKISEMNRESGVGGFNPKGIDNYTTTDSTSRASSLSDQKVAFVKGEDVLLVKGEMQGLYGKVADVKNRGKTLMVKLDSSFEIAEAVDVEAENVMKIMKIGMRAEILSGPRAGETGVIVFVSENFQKLTLVSDSDRSSIQIRAQNVKRTTRTSQGHKSLDGYSLHDVVALSHTDVGMIVRVDHAGFQVLKTSNNVQNMAREAISGKQTRSKTATDPENRMMDKGTRVRVDSNHQKTKGSTARILYIHRAFVFCKVDGYNENSGVRVFHRSKLHVVGSGKSSRGALGSTGVTLAAEAHGRSATGDNSTRVQSNRRQDKHDMAGRRVKVVSGRYRSYRGMVIGGNGATLNVELEALGKRVKVNMGMVKDLGGNSSGIGAPSMGMGHGSNNWIKNAGNSGLGGATPVHHGGATPNHSMDDEDLRFGGQTPGPADTFAPDTYGAANTADDSYSAFTPSGDYAASTTPGSNYHSAASPGTGYNTGPSPGDYGAAPTAAAPSPGGYDNPQTGYEAPTTNSGYNAAATAAASPGGNYGSYRDVSSGYNAPATSYGSAATPSGGGGAGDYGAAATGYAPATPSMDYDAPSTSNSYDQAATPSHDYGAPDTSVGGYSTSSYGAPPTGGAPGGYGGGYNAPATSTGYAPPPTGGDYAPGDNYAPAPTGGDYAPASTGGSYGAPQTGGSYGAAPTAAGGEYGAAPTAAGGEYGAAPTAAGGEYGAAPTGPVDDYGAATGDDYHSASTPSYQAPATGGNTGGY